MTKQNKRETGSKYEKIAADYLTKEGYEILEMNYRCRNGEIDLIAKDGDYLVFCEVKYRSNSLKGHSLEAVDWKKQRRIIGCAQFYLMKHALEEWPIRFDVVGIYGEEICLIKDAFECI